MSHERRRSVLSILSRCALLRAARVANSLIVIIIIIVTIIIIHGIEM